MFEFSDLGVNLPSKTRVRASESKAVLNWLSNVARRRKGEIGNILRER